jgi:uncharacterized protein
LPYNFIFDLSNLPYSFYAEIQQISKKSDRNYRAKLLKTVLKFQVQDVANLTLLETLNIVDDLVGFYKINIAQRNKFLQTKKRALFLPHCSRKYMDNRCRASFDRDIASYKCAHCSPDCLVNKAEGLAKENNYDVYVLAGASCVPKILKTHNYAGVLGVACGEEIKMMSLLLKRLDIAGQAIPLIKNGCCETRFDLDALTKTI